jgi:hypothetical protein
MRYGLFWIQGTTNTVTKGDFSINLSTVAVKRRTTRSATNIVIVDRNSMSHDLCGAKKTFIIRV